MIVAAVLVRGAIDDKQAADTPAIRVVCTPDLEAVCTALRAGAREKVTTTVETATATADELVALAEDVPAPLDVWVAPSPWPAIVDARRERASREVAFGATPVAATSPLVLVAWRDRAAVLAPRCTKGTLSWTCLGTAAAEPGGWAALGGDEAWGRVKLGFPSPRTDGTGLAVLGDAVRSFFGRAALSRADLDDEAFADWFGAVARTGARSSGTAATGTPLARMLSIGRSSLEVVGTTEAEVASVLAPARVGEVTVVYGTTPAAAEVRLALVAGSPVATRARGESFAADLRAALASAGWRTPPLGRPPSGAPIGAPAKTPSPDLVPSAGFLEALLSRWTTVAG